jgi:PPE-repeat protein
MDFGALPPEVNSARMYAGPGAGPMLAAAAAWERLAGELGSAANGYESVIAGLTDEGWLGPASESMAAAAVPYAAWMGATAGQAEQAAAQVTAAASAFAEAHAAMVPPPVIAANRSQLASLVATNVLGQNTAAIAATEAQYGQMWAQDAVTMYGYAGRSAAAVTVTPFAEPPPTTNPAAGLGGQAAAVGQAAASGAHSQLSQLITAMPQALHGLSSAQAAPPPFVPSSTQILSYVEMTARTILPANDAIISILYGLAQGARNLNIGADIAAAGGAAAAGSVSPTAALTSAESAGLGGAGPSVAAGIGNAGSVGKLAVPPSWAEAAPVVKMAAAALPGTSAGAAPAVAAPVPGGLFADMALAALAGRAIAGTAPRGRPAAVMNGHAQGRLERLVTELAGTHEVQHWHTDPSRLDSLLAELSQKPGVHAVHLNNDGTKPKLPPQPS